MSISEYGKGDAREGRQISYTFFRGPENEKVLMVQGNLSEGESPAFKLALITFYKKLPDFARANVLRSAFPGIHSDLSRRGVRVVEGRTGARMANFMVKAEGYSCGQRETLKKALGEPQGGAAKTKKGVFEPKFNISRRLK